MDTNSAIAVSDLREVNDSFLRAILAATVKQMENNPYCREILSNANYQPFETSEPRSEHFDKKHFYLEKIYVGHGSDGPYGHCMREKISDAPNSPTRDVVYINENFIKTSVINILEIMAKNGNKSAQDLTSKNIPPVPSAKEQKFMNFQSIFESLPSPGNKKLIENVWRYTNIRDDLCATLLQDKDFSKDFIKPLSDFLTNVVAHECSHANQFNNGYEVEPMQSKSLYGKELQNKEILLENFISNKSKQSSAPVPQEKIIEGRSVEVILEAGVMAHSYVAFLLTNPNSDTINFLNDSMYNPRLNEHKLEVISKDELKEMSEQKGGKYTAKAIKLQQQCARHIFKSILEDFGRQQMEKVPRGNGKPPPNLNCNSKECLEAIVSSYQESVFGSIDEFIALIPESGLNKENQKEIKAKFSNSSKNGLDSELTFQESEPSVAKTKLGDVRTKLKQKDIKEKELSTDEIKSLIKQHTNNSGNNNTIASIAVIGNKKKSRD